MSIADLRILSNLWAWCIVIFNKYDLVVTLIKRSINNNNDFNNNWLSFINHMNCCCFYACFESDLTCQMLYKYNIKRGKKKTLSQIRHPYLLVTFQLPNRASFRLFNKIKQNKKRNVKLLRCLQLFKPCNLYNQPSHKTLTKYTKYIV